MRRLMIDLSGPRHRLQWLCRVGGLRISLFVCAFLANLTCPHGSLEAEPNGGKRSRTWRCSGVCTSLDTAQGLILIFSFLLSCLQEDIWTHPRRAHLKHSPPALSPSCVCAWNLYTHAYASAAFVQAHDIQQQTVCAQRQISTPPLPTQHTDMKADGLDNGNSAVHFAVVNQADAGAHNIDHKEFKDFFGYSPSVSQQIRKEEEADEDVDTFDEIVDIPPAQESTASHSRPPKAPGQSLSKPPGFEDYALSPTSNATQTELLHRFDLNKLISSLPSVASPPMVSPEVQQRRGQLANPSSILQLVPAALMPDLEQMPTYGAPVSRLGPQDNLPAQTTSPSKLSTETSPPRIPASPTPDVHISHNPNPHSTAFDERPPSSNVPALNTLAEQQPTTQSGEQTSTEGGGKPYEGQYAGSTDQDQVAAWISDVIRETVSQPLEESLRSGVVLCTLINKLKPGTIGKVSRSTMPFPMRENIKAFCDACRALGVPDRDNFTTDDLFEQRNMKQVILCLLSLGRRSYQIPGYCGPCLGKPELANAGASKQSKFRIQTSTYR
eukprot:Tamp_07674.p1 GENE.Tamp_07674~~Tamp_07674.p1  ORF type:complete len:553 (+),score=41.17 Tamp_07674:650-2308(+)